MLSGWSNSVLCARLGEKTFRYSTTRDVYCGFSMSIVFRVKYNVVVVFVFFFFQAEDGIRDHCVTGVQTCALPISRAMELTMADFGRTTRPYNVAVLPAKQTEGNDQQGLLYVYLYPAQTKVGTYPLGGDVRYLVSADGLKMLAKRQMHKTILDVAPKKGKKMVAGDHTHVLSDEPEDTDVLHVLQQDPPLSEMVATQRFLYEVASDGTIRIKKQKK